MTAEVGSNVIVLSLVLVVAAAVSLLVGLFATESLTLIFVAIGLCVASLALLFVGSRQRRQEPATAGGPVSYGAPPTSAGAPVGGARPVSTPAAAADDGAEDTEVVRKTTARDAATKRVTAGTVGRIDVADEPAETEVAVEQDEAEADTPAAAATEAEAAVAATPRKAAKKVVKKSAAKKGAAKKTAAKKTAAKKTATKKTATKKAATKTAATTTSKKTTKAAAKKSAKKTAAKKTTGAAARARLDEISGIGAAKRDALLSRFGSLESIATASQDEIAGVEGFGPALAKRVKDALS